MFTLCYRLHLEMNGEECSIELPDDQLKGLKPGQSVTIEIQATVEGVEGETLKYTYEWAEVYPEDGEKGSESDADSDEDMDEEMPMKRHSKSKKSGPPALA